MTSVLTLDRAQELLSALGYDPGPADGALGPKTKKALQSFQVDQHILVTGILDRLTEERLVMESIKQGVDKKMPWWGWAMIAFGSTLALYGLYKLATYKPEEDGEPLYKLAYDRVDPYLPAPAPPQSWQRPRFPEPATRALPPAASLEQHEPPFSSPVTTPAPLPPRTVFVQEEYGPEPPRTERMDVAPMTSPMSEPPTVLYDPLVRNLPPPPRRIPLSEILDVNHEAEVRARKMVSPKSARYEDVLRNERMRVMSERKLR